MSDYSSDDYEDDEEEYVPVQLEECHKCGRKFNLESLARHSKICDKVSKPRKVFNSRKQRLEGLEAVEAKKTKVTPSVAQKAPRKKDWRRQHEEFIKTIRSARGVTAAQKTGAALPPPPSPTFNPDYIQCEYCNRRFNESAAERHINFCKEQKSRLPKQSGDSKFSVKKEKQQKRQQYKPPMPGQRKVSAESPVKRRGGSSGPVSSPGAKPVTSPGPIRRNIPIPEKKSKSDTVIAGRRKARNDNDDRPLNTNSRYSKTSSGFSSPGSDNEKPRSGKNRNGDPKWFEDLKRHDSGKNARTPSNYDELDSGMDLNDNFTYRTNKKEHPVGVVRPSSRSKESGLGEERNVSAGRRKMANFCHDCGTKYPVTDAKFCCECGVRRMALT